MKRITLRILPLAAALLAAAPAAAQEQPPAPGPLRPFQVPRVEEFRLPNGLRVAVVRQTSLPIVTGRLLLNAGSVYEPADKAGLAVLTANVIDEGVRGITGAQLAERMERLGAQFSTSGGYRSAAVGVTATKTAFAEALELAAKTVIEPTFPETDFNRVRTQTIAQYQQALSTVEGLSSEAFARAVFTASSPYARNSSGTRETLQRITVQDVTDFHRRMYSPANATLLLVGDVTVADARRAAERAFASWQGSAVQLPRIDDGIQQAQATRVILVDRPGSVQSGIWVGQPSLGYSDPSFLTMTALSQVLGGGFRARVNMNLRERHGWTYGAFTNYRPLDAVGTFAVSTAVRTNATDSALVETVKEFRTIATEPVPADELAGALSNLVGSFPNTVQTVQQLAGRMETLLLYGLPLDYWSTYRERLAGTTPDALARLARQQLRPNALTIVVAGDLSKIEAPVRALNLGPVEVWDPAGNKVR